MSPSGQPPGQWDFNLGSPLQQALLLHFLPREMTFKVRLAPICLSNKSKNVLIACLLCDWPRDAEMCFPLAQFSKEKSKVKPLYSLRCRVRGHSPQPGSQGELPGGGETYCGAGRAFPYYSLDQRREVSVLRLWQVTGLGLKQTG